jgi:hypothetical protein
MDYLVVMDGLFVNLNIVSQRTVQIKFTPISTSFFSWFDRPSGSRPPKRGSSDTLSHITLGRTPLDEWSPRRSKLFLKTHNTHRFEPAIPTNERPQTNALIARSLGSAYFYFPQHNKARRCYRVNEPTSYVQDRYKLVNTHIFFTARLHTQTRVGT